VGVAFCRDERYADRVSHPNVVSCLWFDKNAAEAAEFYVRALPGGRIDKTAHSPESVDTPSGAPRGSVLTVAFEAGGRAFIAVNGGPHFKPTPSISFFVELDSAAEVDRVASALADGGQALMPVGSYPWSERYGWVQDRYGFTWQIMLARAPGAGPQIFPCLMFSDAQHKRAEEAMRRYVEIFPGSELGAIARYEAGEGDVGTVKHGRFKLAGQLFAAMDSHVPHGFAFNEAISFQVMCKDQAEVDRYWMELSAGGSESRCGWLKDRFGLSWQIVPVDMPRWMTSGDAAARDRTFQAMLPMKKLDIATLARAFEGR